MEKKIDLDKVDGIVINIEGAGERQTHIRFYQGTVQHDIEFIPDELKHEEYVDRFDGQIVIRFNKNKPPVDNSHKSSQDSI